MMWLFNGKDCTVGKYKNIGKTSTFSHGRIMITLRASVQSYCPDLAIVDKYTCSFI